MGRKALFGNQRQKSSAELADETEFSRRQAAAGEVKQMSAGRSFDVHLIGHYPLPTDLGSKHESTTRGKVTSVSYFLPKIDGYATIAEWYEARRSGEWFARR